MFFYHKNNNQRLFTDALTGTTRSVLQPSDYQRFEIKSSWKKAEITEKLQIQTHYMDKVSRHLTISSGQGKAAAMKLVKHGFCADVNARWCAKLWQSQQSVGKLYTPYGSAHFIWSAALWLSYCGSWMLPLSIITEFIVEDDGSGPVAAVVTVTVPRSNSASSLPVLSQMFVTARCLMLYTCGDEHENIWIRGLRDVVQCIWPYSVYCVCDK